MRKVAILFLSIILVACGGSSSDKPKTEAKTAEAKQENTKSDETKTETALDADRKVVKTVHDQMAEIENQFLKGQGELVKMLDQLSKSKKKLSEEEKKRMIQEKFIALGHILDRSKTLDVPKIKNSGAAIMMTNALNTHKKWSQTQGAKLLAVINGDNESAKKYAVEADALAMKEAQALDRAFKEVGLE